jgi:hypothetical protein
MQMCEWLGVSKSGYYEWRRLMQNPAITSEWIAGRNV